MEQEKKISLDMPGQLPPVLQSMFTPTVAARGDSPSRRSKIQLTSNIGRKDDLEELDDDDDEEEEEEEEEDDEDIDEDAEEMEEVELPIDEADDSSTPAPSQHQLWSGDWSEVQSDRKSTRKRPAIDDLPDEVREELAVMGGVEVETRIRQRPKLEPPDTGKEVSRGRKSPIAEEPTDLLQIIQKPAKTPEERLAVLEARDKLIRNSSSEQRNTHLKNVGKCPDMCPEKERYQRIARHQVEYYEYNRDTKNVNHALMVKIYARSSADQQMPLPHDLRPENVLWMTMSYLISQLVDLADNPSENLGEWYHFLWDRMRSIRKDITQLALCDTFSVQILEMCARFHIFCMERLREEKMAVFDEKINRENLTKCLQSLQYMYNDLSLKDVSCPNEPEFQAYSILLHINSDLCTSIIVGLRPEMRKHPKVQFAINAFVAVTMKNYVRFFKLVKATSFLNACILHQYFAQVRAHAMHSIIRAYSRQKMRNTYPLSELEDQLLFDSRTDVLEFCKFSKVPVEDSNIVLEKNVSHPIPMQEKMKRSFAGVEEKRQSSIKEIVTGGCLLTDNSVYHIVHDSFDERGILKPEAWYAQDQDAVTKEEGTSRVQEPSKIFSAGSTRSIPVSVFSSTGSLQKKVSVTSVTAGSQRDQSIVQKVDPSTTQKFVFSVQPTGKHTVQTQPTSQDFGYKSDSLKELSTQPSISCVQEFGWKSSTVSTTSSSTFKMTSDKINKPFVFHLVENTSVTEDDNKKSSVTQQAQVSTTSSIFGGSAPSVPRSPGASVMRSFGKSTNLKAALWSSQKQQSEVETIASGNYPEVLDVEMASPVPKSSEFSFVSSSGSPSVTASSSLISASSNLWSSKPLVTITHHDSCRTTAATSVINFAPAITSAFNQFPSSVYGLKTQESNSVVLPHTLAWGGMTSVPTDLSQTDDVAHKSPTTRDVTVPTSIFGFNSRPLSTPQMFPTSSASSTSTVSPSITHSVSSVHTSSPVVVTKALSPKVSSSGFTFTLKRTDSFVPNYMSSTPQPFFPDKSVKLKEISPMSVPIPFVKLTDESENEEYSSTSNSEMSDAEEKEEEEGLNTDDESFLYSSKYETPKFKSHLRTLSKPLISPSLKKELAPTKILGKKKVSVVQVHQLVAEIAHKWRLLAYRSKVKRRNQSHNICVPLGTQLSLEEQVNEFPIPQGCVAVDIQTRLDCVLGLEDLKTIRLLLPDIGKVKLENVICHVLPPVLFQKKRLESNMFWKLFISLPGELEGKKYCLELDGWIENTFSGDSGMKSDGILRVFRSQIGEEYNLFTSVQKTIGCVNSTLKGVNGLLFFTPRNTKDVEQVHVRLQQVIKSQQQSLILPLVIVLGNSQWKEICERWCEKEVQRHTIAAFKIIGPLYYDKDFVAQELKSSISWLSKNINPCVELEKWPLKEILTTLMMDLWTRVRYSLASRCSSGMLQHPEDLINLYHDTLNRFCSMVVNDKLCQYGDIPLELEDLASRTLGENYESRTLLKSTRYIRQIEEGFHAVKFDVKVPSGTSLSVESFCEAACLFNDRLRSPISHFLWRRNSDDDTDWTEVIEAVLDIHIRDVISKLKLQKLIVIFEKRALHEFCTNPWYSKWLVDRLSTESSCGDGLPCDDTTSSWTDLNNANDSASNLDKVSNSEEQLIECFECILNNLDEEISSIGVHTGQTSINKSVSPKISSMSESGSTCELDFFEMQLDNYAKLLLD